MKRNYKIALLITTILGLIIYIVKSGPGSYQISENHKSSLDQLTLEETLSDKEMVELEKIASRLNHLRDKMEDLKKNTNTLTRESIVIKNENQVENEHRSPAEFQKYIEGNYATIPRIAAYKNILGSDRAKEVPTLIQAGKFIADVLNQMKQNPELTMVAMNFFEDCALDTELIPATRALCLYHYNKTGNEIDNLPKTLNVETSISDLALEIPN